MPPLTPFLGFIGPSYVAQSPKVDAERTVNLMLESRGKGTPAADRWFYAMPGLLAAVTMTGGSHRASFQMDSRSFCVVGTIFWEWDGVTATNRGTVADDGKPASIASNGPGGNQVLVIAGGNGYIFNLVTNAFAQIADVDFPTNAGMASFLDGYFIVNQKNTAKFYLSALEDGTNWDPLDVAQTSQTADFIVVQFVDLDRKTLWLLGSQSTEIWWDSGATFPFEPVPNAILSVGVAGVAAWAQPDNANQWIGESTNGSRYAYEGEGVQSKKISTPAVDFAWSQYTTVADCAAFAFEYRGHTLTAFNFPTADVTWVYDRTEDNWFEWLSWDATLGVYHQQLGATHFFAFNTHYLGSRRDGVLYKMSSDYLTDNGTSVRWLRRAPHIASSGCLVCCSELRFAFQVGVGLPSGQGSNPQVMLRISRDGGYTWGPERWASLGALGDYLRRVRFLRNGCWRDGVLELSGADPVVRALVECSASLRKATT